MIRRRWRFGAFCAVAVLTLIGVEEVRRAGAQDAPPRHHPAGGHLARVGNSYINLGQMTYARFDGSDPPIRVDVYFAGVRESERLVLVGKEAGQFKALLDGLTAGAADKPDLKAEAAPKPLLRLPTEPPLRLPGVPEVKAVHEGPKREGPAGSGFWAFDDFEGKFSLNWRVVRPEPSHVSLNKNPGKLTITTQRGSIHGDEKNEPFGEGIQAKNLYLIDNILASEADFVVTTCVSGFTPETSYQQAGLIVYNDDDNYLKFGYEYNWPKEGGQAFCILTETDAKSEFSFVESESGLKRYWVRLTKRGDKYEYATSADGKDFRAHGVVAWGDGAPKRIGILAKNGGNKEAGELDAAFEFFELRSPAPKKASE